MKQAPVLALERTTEYCSLHTRLRGFRKNQTHFTGIRPNCGVHARFQPLHSPVQERNQLSHSIAANSMVADAPAATHQERAPPIATSRGKVAAVGAGPGGLLAALLLAQQGYTVEIFEKRSEPSKEEMTHGSRSIVFGLLPRGQVGLRAAGVRLPERGKGPTWLNGLSLSKGAVFHRHVDGKATTTGPLALKDVLFVERAALVEHLILELERLQPDRIQLRYGHSLESVDFDARTAVFASDQGAHIPVNFDLLVGSDGLNSKVRALLEQRDSSLTHHIKRAERSYKGFHRLPFVDELDLGDDSGSTVHFFTNGRVVNFSSTIWPTRYGTVTGHLSCPREWFETKLNTAEEYEKVYHEKFPTFPRAWLPEVCRQLVEATAYPNGASVKCSKLHGPSTVILGDAAHGVTPAMGQGCNAALESAHILTRVLGDTGHDIASAAEKFTQARLTDAHALYVMDTEARSRMGTNGPFNLLRLATQFHALLGFALKKLFPGRFKGPAYVGMMTSLQPYSEIYRAVNRDENIFYALLAAFVAVSAFAVRSALPESFGV